MLNNKKREEKAKIQREKTNEFIRKYWKVLLGGFIVFILIMSFGILNERNDKANGNKIEINSSSSEFKGKNYEDVVTQLQKAGFTNIKTEALDDLITGLLTKDGEVKQVEIDGKTTFSANTSFAKDSKIVITYHTFPKKEKSDTDSTGGESSSPKEKSDTDSTGGESSGASLKSNQEILTVNNNQDLANLLAVKNEFDPIISEFAKKYNGKTIEFNGNIAQMMPHENYKTRFDFLICVGDYSKTSAVGPNFKFKDVNISDLHLTGSKIPENIVAGQNIHVIAKVVEYNEKQGLLFLTPISTEIR